MKKETKYINGEIQLSWLKDKRHKTKPYTKEMWEKYINDYYKYNSKELAKKYKVKIRTIYKWNSEIAKKAKNYKIPLYFMVK